MNPLRQAGSDLRRSGETREIRACAWLCAVVRAPERPRYGPIRADSVDFSPQRGDAGPPRRCQPRAPPHFATCSCRLNSRNQRLRFCPLPGRSRARHGFSVGPGRKTTCAFAVRADRVRCSGTSLRLKPNCESVSYPCHEVSSCGMQRKAIRSSSLRTGFFGKGWIR